MSIRRNRGLLEAAVVLAVLLQPFGAGAERIEDRARGFRAVISPGGGFEIEIHFWTEGSTYYDGIPQREVAGKGGWTAGIELRRDGRAIETGEANEVESFNVTWTVDGLESATLAGTVPTWDPVAESDTGSEMTFEVALTGEGLAEPTLFPYRYVNPHRIEAGVALQMSRAVSGTVSVSSGLHGEFATSVADGEITTLDRTAVGENVIDPDRAESRSVEFSRQILFGGRS